MNRKFLNKILIITVVAVASFILWSCSDNSQNAETKPALQMTIAQIEATPGYAWFQTELDSYHPVGSIMDSIKNEFIKRNCDFYVFVNPSCSCVGTQKSFPHFMKILDLAEIKGTNIKIFSMLSYKSPHPYQSVLTLTTLPSLYIIRNQKAVYSVLDTLQYYQAINSNADYTLEEFILKGLKAN